MYRKKFLTQIEIEDIINQSDDDDETGKFIRNADIVDLVILPPEQVDEISDLEDIDDDMQILSDANCPMPNDVAGLIELNCLYNDGNINDKLPALFEMDSYENVEDVSTSKPMKNKKSSDGSDCQNKSNRQSIVKQKNTKKTKGRKSKTKPDSNCQIIQDGEHEVEAELPIEQHNNSKTSKRELLFVPKGKKNVNFPNKPVDVQNAKADELYNKLGWFVWYIFSIYVTKLFY